MRALAIIQARLGSTRLPGKVLADLGGLPVIAHVYQRVAHVLPAVVAFPAADDALYDACLQQRIPCYPYRGDPEDVLARYRTVAALYHAETIVRVTADCPFVQPAHIQAVLLLAESHKYAALGPQSGWPDGCDVEAFHRDWLDRIFTDREHVTAGTRPAVRVTCTPSLAHLRLTLDTAEDLTYLRQLAATLDCSPPEHPTFAEVVTYATAHPRRLPDQLEAPVADHPPRLGLLG